MQEPHPRNAQKQPLPHDEIRRNRLHAKTASDLPQTGELPVVTLEKSIPKHALRDM